MALQDIIAAITQQADLQIENARKKHQKRLTELREECERSIAKKKQEIAIQKEQRKEQLEAKAKTHAAMLKRNASLRKKQEMLDETYDLVVQELAKLDQQKTESLLRLCIKQVNTKGTIHPAHNHVELLKKIAPSDQFTIGETIESQGGFRFVSEKEEQDFTYEHLISHVLRPNTEVQTARDLFGSAA